MSDFQPTILRTSLIWLCNETLFLSIKRINKQNISRLQLHQPLLQNPNNNGPIRPPSPLNKFEQTFTHSLDYRQLQKVQAPKLNVSTMNLNNTIGKNQSIIYELYLQYVSGIQPSSLDQKASRFYSPFRDMENQDGTQTMQAILPRRSHLGALNYSFSKASSVPNHQRS